MTEFAFSGVGINPDFGTPGNPHDRRLIPGGSSSGAAVSVGDVQALVAIGSDTGGRAHPGGVVRLGRVQAERSAASRATASSRSRQRSTSIGPLANSIACCAIADAVMAGEPAEAPAPIPATGCVCWCRARMCSRGSIPRSRQPSMRPARRCRGPAHASPIGRFPSSTKSRRSTRPGEFAPIEAYAWHRDLIARRGGDYDPRVRGRIERAQGMSAVEYIELRDARAALIARMAPLTAGFDAMLMPTVAITAPPITAFIEDPDYRRLNALILRNCSTINFLDRCAATGPIQKPGEAPVGLMIVGEHGGDRRLLAVARGIERRSASLRPDRRFRTCRRAVGKFRPSAARYARPRRSAGPSRHRGSARYSESGSGRAASAALTGAGAAG